MGWNCWEKALILKSTVVADDTHTEKSWVFPIDPGNDTQDQVFILSLTEVYQYFGKNGSAECDATKYAIAEGSSGSWWARSPGKTQTFAAVVNKEGKPDAYGTSAQSDSISVRPALWIEFAGQ